MGTFYTKPSKSKSARERNLGSKRCCRFSISVGSETDKKLNALAVSTGFSKSELCDILLQTCVNSAEMVFELQERYNKNQKYRVYPTVVIENGRKQMIYG